jgi:hypothetical protein
VRAIIGDNDALRVIDNIAFPHDSIVGVTIHNGHSRQTKH